MTDYRAGSLKRGALAAITPRKKRNKMKKQIQQLMYMSYNEVEQRYYSGLIGQTTWEAYNRVWTWSAVRWSNVARASDLQEKFWHNYGKDKFYARINKVRAAFGFAPLNRTT